MSKILIGRGDTDLDYPVCRPSLDLDFTQEELDPRITFTRGSIGTRVNRNRLIETVDANQPRFDYDPVTGECKGLLIEESRTNLLTYSGFPQTTSTSFPTGWDGWNPATCLRSQTLSPNGIDYGIFHGAVNQNGGGIKKDLTGLSPSTTFTLSFWGKKITQLELTYFAYNNIRGTATGTTDGARNVSWFAASKCSVEIGSLNGTGASGGGQSVLTEVWQRFSFQLTTDNAGSIRIIIANNVGDTGTGNEDGGGTWMIWGAQLEVGTFPTSYIPTTTSTINRPSDLARITGTNFSSWYNSSEGTLYAAARINALGGSGYPGIVYVDDGTLNNCIGLVFMDASNDDIASEAYKSGSNQYFLSSSSAVIPNQLTKGITAYQQNNFASAFSNRTSVASDRNGVIPTVNRMIIGDLRGGNGRLNGTISRITYWPRALKPNQLQYLTQ